MENGKLDPISEAVIDKLENKKVDYYIYFECWHIRAASEIEALAIAKKRLASGEVPTISDVGIA
jgi:hypothetical protein